MNRTKIGLVNLGEHLPIRLESLAKKLNKLQDAFHFEVAFTISVEKIGKPEREQWYDYRTLIASISSVQQSKEYEYLLGVTRFPITDLRELGQLHEVDYFSQSDYQKHGIISVSPNIGKYLSKDKDWYQYASFSCMCELLIIMCETDLSHPEQKFCLFDECDNRVEIRACIDNGAICDKDKDIIKTKIDPEIVRQAEQVLKWCSSKRLHVAIKNTWLNPLFMLLTGVFFGWWIPVMYPHGNNYILLLWAFIFLMFVVYFRYRPRNDEMERY